MSKYLNADSQQHHYETIVKSTYKKHINYINTMREYANEYQSLIQNNINFPARKLGKAMELYNQIFAITKLMLLHIENNLYTPQSWNISMMKVNRMVDEFEKLTLYGGKNANKTD
jgi:hypothetical protein